MTPLRIAFLGTPAFARTTLEHLYASRHQTAVVITQPDRPRGRGQRLTPSAVKAFAVEHGLAVLQPDRLKDEVFLTALAGYGLDLAVVAAYGRILPAGLLDIPRLGTINVHASLLPRWRGAAPVHRAILAGDRETGVTIMRVVPALDAGPTLARSSCAIDPNETSADLERRLAVMGAELLVATVDRLASGRVEEVEQPGEGVTYASRLERGESRLDWDQPAGVVHNRIRGLQPWPVVTVIFRGRRLQLLGSEILHDRVASATPGTVSEVDADAFSVACRPGAVRLTRVQLEGRPPTTVREFLNGHHIVVGDVFDPLPLA